MVQVCWNPGWLVSGVVCAHIPRRDKGETSRAPFWNMAWPGGDDLLIYFPGECVEEAGGWQYGLSDVCWCDGLVSAESVSALVFLESGQ